MIFNLPIFTLIHVVISVLAIITGLVVVGGLMVGGPLDRWTKIFLSTTILTSITGFGFPPNNHSPARFVGVISLVVLAVCIAARYWKQLEGGWRATYVVTAVISLYLNVFVLIAQLFAKTPALAQLAPTQQESPFVVTQTFVFILFVWLGREGLRGFRIGRIG